MALALQIPRFKKRLFCKDKDYLSFPPVLCNSFPKSGTHLLKQILEVLPLVNDYGTFWATMPSLSFKERLPEELLSKIYKLVPGEIVTAHLLYNEKYHKALGRKNAVHFFIYRDLRDVVISEAYYLTFMNKWHCLHRYYNSLPSNEARISFAIEGASVPGFQYCYPNIAERFRRYMGWLSKSEVYTIKFEDLVSEQQEEVVTGIVKFYLEHFQQESNEELIVRNALANISPSNSHTFRQGKVRGWQNVFSHEHKEQMKAIAGDLLIELEYEKDTNW